MKIDIQTIPHKEQRYDTCGDYWEDSENVIHFRISQMSDTRYEWLVMVHELVEWCLVKIAGISMQSIDDFDMNYDNSKGEPGDDHEAPYFMQHQLATALERLFAVMLGVLWKDYEKEINMLEYLHD